MDNVGSLLDLIDLKKYPATSRPTTVDILNAFDNLRCVVEASEAEQQAARSNLHLSQTATFELLSKHPRCIALLKRFLLCSDTRIALSALCLLALMAEALCEDGVRTMYRRYEEGNTSFESHAPLWSSTKLKAAHRMMINSGIHKDLISLLNSTLVGITVENTAGSGASRRGAAVCIAEHCIMGLSAMATYDYDFLLALIHTSEVVPVICSAMELLGVYGTEFRGIVNPFVALIGFLEKRHLVVERVNFASVCYGPIIELYRKALEYLIHQLNPREEESEDLLGSGGELLPSSPLALPCPRKRIIESFISILSAVDFLTGIVFDAYQPCTENVSCCRTLLVEAGLMRLIAGVHEGLLTTSTHSRRETLLELSDRQMTHSLSEFYSNTTVRGAEHVFPRRRIAAEQLAEVLEYLPQKHLERLCVLNTDVFYGSIYSFFDCATGSALKTEYSAAAEALCVRRLRASIFLKSAFGNRLRELSGGIVMYSVHFLEQSRLNPLPTLDGSRSEGDAPLVVKGGLFELVELVVAQCVIQLECDSFGRVCYRCKGLRSDEEGREQRDHNNGNNTVSVEVPVKEEEEGPSCACGESSPLLPPLPDEKILYLWPTVIASLRCLSAIGFSCGSGELTAVKIIKSEVCLRFVSKCLVMSHDVSIIKESLLVLTALFEHIDDCEHQISQFSQRESSALTPIEGESETSLSSCIRSWPFPFVDEIMLPAISICFSFFFICTNGDEASTAIFVGLSEPLSRIGDFLTYRSLHKRNPFGKFYSKSDFSERTSSHFDGIVEFIVSHAGSDPSRALDLSKKLLPLLVLYSESIKEDLKTEFYSEDNIESGEDCGSDPTRLDLAEVGHYFLNLFLEKLV